MQQKRKKRKQKKMRRRRMIAYPGCTLGPPQTASCTALCCPADPHPMPAARVMAQVRKCTSLTFNK